MSKNLRITLAEPSGAIPAFYADDDGLFSFDLFQGTDVAITRQVDEATEIGSIRQDTVRNFEIPATKKNRALIGPLGNPQAFGTIHFNPFPVQIFVGDYRLPERFARLVNANDRGGFEIEVTGDQFGWIKPITDLKFSSLDLGTFDFTEANVENQQEFHFAFADGDDLVNFPLVNYGAWPLEDRVALEDFRPWFNALGLLQAAFCSIGWTFRCPILETDYGRRVWTYILKKDFRSASVVLAGKAFQAELTADLDLKSAIGCLPFDDDFTPPNADPGGNYDPVTGAYSTQSTADYFFSGSMTIVSAGDNGLILAWLKIDQFGNTVRIKEEVFNFQVDGTFPIELNVANVELNSTDSICLHVTSFAFNTTTYQLDAGATIRNIVTAAPYSRGDTLILSSLVNEEMRAIDYLKGIIHLFNLKPDTNSTLKTVTFYPENGAEDFYFEGDQEAFFFPNEKSKDWTDKIQCRSLLEDLEGKDLTNEYLLAFKETTDPGVEKLNLDLPLHSELIENVSGVTDFKKGRTENRNPFFEPTRNDIDRQIGVPFTNVTTLPYIPFIWDKEPDEGEFVPDEQADNIKPRIVLFYGYEFVGLTSTAAGAVNPAFAFYRKEDGTTKQEYLLAGQILKTGVSLNAFPNASDEALVYGTDLIRPDLLGNYEYLYQETIRNFYFAFPIEFLILLTLNDLINFSNRDRIFFRYFSEIYGDLSLFARVVKIEDFLINRELTTPVQFLPAAKFFDTICD
jgi:hypothetical protein